MQQNAERLAYLEAILVGKPIGMTKSIDVQSLVGSLRYFAGFVDKNEGDLILDKDGFLRGTLHQPFGITAAVIPFNAPLTILGMKIGPGLAAGNAIIVKASERNPFSTLAVAELAIQAGVPPGVLNFIVGGPASGDRLARHESIRMISFTGSPAVGKLVAAAAASTNLKRVTLELGGKNPVLVFADADIPTAMRNCMAFTAMNGQACAVASRIYVQEDIAENFVAGLSQMAQGMTKMLGGDPLDERTITSPLYNHSQKERVLGFLESGRSDAETLAGGEPWGEKGCFIKPTIFYKPAANARVLKEEIFGPVAIIDTFKTEEEALSKANDTIYGLSAYAWTNSIDRALRLCKAMDAGSIAINTPMPTHPTIPFGGWKESGLGQENSKYAMRAWTQPKSIVIKSVTFMLLV